MSKILGTILIITCLFFMFLGAVFIIASGTENFIIGGILILLGFCLLIFVYLDSKREDKRPTIVEQTFHVQMAGSGKFHGKELKCRSCGGIVKDENMKVIEGGIMVSCPFCGKVEALEEEPKW